MSMPPWRPCCARSCCCCRSTAARAPLPDFAALRAMLFYMDEFPERRHHLKESQLLFPKLRQRRRSRPVLDRLDQDHARGERAIRDLEHALLGFEMMGEPRRDAFEQAVQHYADFYFQHMSLEEKQILPAGRKRLTTAGLGRAGCGLRRQPRPAHRPRAGRRLPRTVQPHRQCAAGTAGAGRGALTALPSRPRGCGRACARRRPAGSRGNAETKLLTSSACSACRRVHRER